MMNQKRVNKMVARKCPNCPEFTNLTICTKCGQETNVYDVNKIAKSMSEQKCSNCETEFKEKNYLTEWIVNGEKHHACKGCCDVISEALDKRRHEVLEGRAFKYVGSDEG